MSAKRRSPYGEKVARGERPFTYSQEYQDWHRLAKGAASEQALADARERFERRQHRLAEPERARP